MKTIETVTKEVKGQVCHYRNDAEGMTGDERILEEVVAAASYRKASLGFDVEPGEHWLDLGANIGAFAIYCRMRGAKTTCYEPDPDCFVVLKLNAPKSRNINAAVTANQEPRLSFFQSPRNTHARGTVLAVHGYKPQESIRNVYAGTLTRQVFDGIKMDVEGSEGPILDEWLLPRAEKLVLEYHTSRDDSVANLVRRLKLLKKHYKNVVYSPEYDQAIADNANTCRTFYDRLIFAWGLK